MPEQAEKAGKGLIPGGKGQKALSLSKLQELANVASQENLQEHSDTKFHGAGLQVRTGAG